MSREKLRIHNTELDNLVGNLRGEVGEIITSWTLLRHLEAETHTHRAPDDIAADFANRTLTTLRILAAKLHDDIIARLSELAERKVGRLTFYFASEKLGKLESEVDQFARFVRASGFEEKRNLDISHKTLPEKWSDHRHRHIPYSVVIRALALASRLMKLIDREVLGPASPYLWAEMRKKRYEPMTPPKVGYLIMPHLRLSARVRAKVMAEEEAEGQKVWEALPTIIDGHAGTMLACRKWGGIVVGNRLIMLEEYPLQQIQRIDTAASTLDVCAPDVCAPDV